MRTVSFGSSRPRLQVMEPAVTCGFADVVQDPFVVVTLLSVNVPLLRKLSVSVTFSTELGPKFVTFISHLPICPAKSPLSGVQFFTTDRSPPVNSLKVNSTTRTPQSPPEASPGPTSIFPASCAVYSWKTQKVAGSTGST